MNDSLPDIFVCARRPASLRPSEVAQGYFAEFVEARRARVKREADELLKNAADRADKRRFTGNAVTGFGQLEQA